MTKNWVGLCLLGLLLVSQGWAEESILPASIPVSVYLQRAFVRETPSDIEEHTVAASADGRLLFQPYGPWSPTVRSYVIKAATANSDSHLYDLPELPLRALAHLADKIRDPLHRILVEMPDGSLAQGNFYRLRLNISQRTPRLQLRVVTRLLRVSDEVAPRGESFYEVITLSLEDVAARAHPFHSNYGHVTEQAEDQHFALYPDNGTPERVKVLGYQRTAKGESLALVALEAQLASEKPRRMLVAKVPVELVRIITANMHRELTDDLATWKHIFHSLAATNVELPWSKALTPEERLTENFQAIRKNLAAIFGEVHDFQLAPRGSVFCSRDIALQGAMAAGR